MNDAFPHPGGHSVLIAEPDDLVPGEEVWVKCLPHGDIGSWPTRLEAVIKALKHDEEHGGMSGQHPPGPREGARP